jgi:sortase A
MSLGTVCLAWAGVELVRAQRFQRNEDSALERALEADRASSPVPAATRAAPTVRPDAGVIGRLEIPRLRMSAVVVEGEDQAALRRAVGHLSDTPMPWEDGNSALAGHRDTFFGPLRAIRAGDVLRLTTVGGTLLYRVREMLVVNPEDVGVLAPTPEPMLTLITCYPFFYLGSAPRRYIVRAERIDHD